MSSMKSLFNTFMIAIASLVVVSCVPKATENKANCGKNQAFDSVSRSCYSIEQARRVPVGTATTAATTEEVITTVTLSYTDANLDQAKTCAVSSVSSNIDVMSPWITDGGLLNIAAFNLTQTASTIVTNLPASPERTAALAAQTAMNTAYTKAKNTFVSSTVTSQLAIVQTQVGIILANATTYLSLPNVQNAYNLTQQNLTIYNTELTEANNKCACSGGVCTAVVIPRLGKNGTAGFSYTVTDNDGPSLPKAVTVSIAPKPLTSIDYLTPIAESSYVSTFAESDTSFAPATAYTFTIPNAGDVSGTASTSMVYTYPGSKDGLGQGITPSGNGFIRDCMDLVGHVGNNDRTCTYIPRNSTTLLADYDVHQLAVTAAKAAVTIGGITYTAKSEGLAGNNFKIQYFNILLTTNPVDSYISKTEKFGMVDPTNEAFIRVIGNTINVYVNPNVTTYSAVASLIASHPQASHLVTVSAGTGVLVDPTLTPTAVNLTGGVDAWDTIPFNVSNGSSTSTNTATVTVAMASTNDKPIVPKTYIGSAYSHTEPNFVEEFAQSVALDFYDVDNATGFLVEAKIDSTLSGTCIPPTYPLSATAETSLSNYFDDPTFVTSAYFDVPAPGVTSLLAGNHYKSDVVINPKVDFTGLACLYYRVTDLGTAKSYVQGIQITVKPINDAPVLSSTAFTVTASNPPVTLLSTVTTAINEDLAPVPALQNYLDIFVSPGGGLFETSQTVTVTASSGTPTLIPNVTCPTTRLSGTGAPTTLPTADTWYMDTASWTCYKFTYTTTGNSLANWKLFPSLTVIPPTTGTSNYKIAYVPIQYQSSTTPVNITVTVVDNGGTAVAGDVNTTTGTFKVAVNFIDNPPVFTKTITSVETNEGGAVQTGAFTVDEDAGSTTDEDAQQIKLISITSDNPSVLPKEAVSVFYDLNNNGVQDSNEDRCFANVTGCANPKWFLDTALATDDVKAHNFYLKLDPVDGVSGNANITITISDGTTPVSTTFAFIVHPVAALHGGWNNISSVGLKTDKNGAPVSNADMVCNFSKSTESNNCAGADCTSGTSPSGIKVPNLPNTLFWDSVNLRCYRSTGKTEYTWVDHNTTCPVTKGAVAVTTLGSAITAASTTIVVADASGLATSNGTIKIESEVIGYTAITGSTLTGLTRGKNSTTAAAHASGVGVVITDYPYIFNSTDTFLIPATTAVNQYYYYTDDKTCHRSYYNGAGTLVWDGADYKPAKVTLAWKPFIMVGSGSDSGAFINGWNVYRREAGTDYNFLGGHLRNSTSTDTFTIVGAATRTFTDTTAVAGKVYYYVVRPVDSARSFPTYTPETFSEVRVLAAPENYAFVHRWIVNQEICNGMNITNTTSPYAIDQTHNFRCPYKGPGESLTSPGYYDYGRDLLVDTQEVGCPYAAAPKCTANGCVGIGAPTASMVANADDLYYDRNSGTCYRNTTNGSNIWETFQATAVNAGLSNKLKSALNAPLVNITPAKADAICSVRTAPTGTQVTFGAPLIPNKKDYNAYSSQRIDLADTEVTDLEQGFSLNVQSRCNGSGASGLETAYTDSAIPSTSFIYSLPGTYSSGIRSLYTGSVPWGSSKGTEGCVSRFGIQDLYGNVAEWTADKVTCTAGGSGYNECTVVTNSDPLTPNSSFTDTDMGGDKYGFNSKSGPYNDINTNKVVDSGDGYLTSWAFADELFGAGKFSYPLALPIDDEVQTTVFSNNSNFVPFVLDIGPSNGITTNKLHEDGIIVNNSTLASKTAFFAVGGSYLSGSKAGRFTSELIEQNIVRPDVGMRCIIPIPPTGYVADPAHPYNGAY